MGRPNKGMAAYLALRTKNPNKKQKARFDITDITKEDFRKLLKKVKSSPYLDYKIKQVHNEPADAYFLLIK